MAPPGARWVADLFLICLFLVIAQPQAAAARKLHKRSLMRTGGRAGRVDASYDVFYGISNNASLYFWGQDPANAKGVKLVPTLLFSGPSKWSQVGSGVWFACGLPLGGGKPLCWNSGKVYDDDNSLNPVVEAGKKVTEDLGQLATGDSHACGITKEGFRLICWGSNDYGQLGNGKISEQASVSEVPGADWVFVSCGSDFTCAIKSDQSLWCFGSNSAHEVSPSNDDAVLKPYQVPGKWKYVSTGSSYTLAIDSEDDAWGWGLSESTSYDASEGGSLGDGKKMCYDPKKDTFCPGWESFRKTEAKPVPVVGKIKWASISAGGGLSCGVEKSTEKAYCWGYTSREAYAEGSPQTNAPKLLDDSKWVTVTVGGSDSRCGIKKEGTNWCWGRNSYNCEGDCPLGDGTRKNSPIPVKVVKVDNWLPGLTPVPGPSPSLTSPSPVPSPSPSGNAGASSASVGNFRPYRPEDGQFYSFP